MSSVEKKAPETKKYQVCARLQREGGGRYEEFSALKAKLKRELGITREEAFWMALKKFPPLVVAEDQD